MQLIVKIQSKSDIITNSSSEVFPCIQYKYGANEDLKELIDAILSAGGSVYSCDDLFDIDGYQRALVEFIKGAEAPLTIALQGGWGSGKTSLMNVLKTELTQESAHYYAIEVNTWHYSMLLYSRPCYCRDFTQYP